MIARDGIWIRRLWNVGEDFSGNFFRQNSFTCVVSSPVLHKNLTATESCFRSTSLRAAVVHRLRIPVGRRSHSWCGRQFSERLYESFIFDQLFLTKFLDRLSMEIRIYERYICLRYRTYSYRGDTSISNYPRAWSKSSRKNSTPAPQCFHKSWGRTLHTFHLHEEVSLRPVPLYQ